MTRRGAPLVAAATMVLVLAGCGGGDKKPEGATPAQVEQYVKRMGAIRIAAPITDATCTKSTGNDFKCTATGGDGSTTIFDVTADGKTSVITDFNQITPPSNSDDASQGDPSDDCSRADVVC